MDLRGPPGCGGEARGVQMAAVDGEAARGRRRLGERLSPVSLASDSGSWLLLHAEWVTAVRFPGLVGDNGGRRWPTTWSKAAAKSEAEQKQHMRRKEKGREPSSAPNKGRLCMGSGDDRR
jgi:hypothetical protein